MTTDPDRAIRSALASIAPEADFDDLAPDVDLQETLDLDSMDFLNFLIALGDATGIRVPESDYARVHTFDGCVGYVRAHLGGA